MLIISTCTLFIVAACTPSKIQDEIDKTEKINEENKEPIVEFNNENELSEEQMEILDDLKDEPGDIADVKDFDKRVELEVEVPVDRKKYKDPDELAQQINYLFYQFHTNEISGKNFYKKISPYFHETFDEMLPSTEADKIETFTVLQKKFIEGIASPIINNQITNTEVSRLKTEISFYRKYELENGDELYFITILKKEGDYWYFADDSPTPPYDILPGKLNELEGINIHERRSFYRKSKT